MSTRASKQLVRKAIKYAIERKKPSVALMHKGNIMKYTEGAFKEWGYQVAKEEFPEFTITEEDVAKGSRPAPPSKVVIKDRIADSMFQQILIRPSEYSVVATPNLNGDYLSDAAVAQVGGLGVAARADNGRAQAVERSVQDRLADVVVVDSIEGRTQGKALDVNEAGEEHGYDARLEGGSGYEEPRVPDVVVMESGLPLKPGMRRDDLL